MMLPDPDPPGEITASLSRDKYRGMGDVVRRNLDGSVAAIQVAARCARSGVHRHTRHAFVATFRFSLRGVVHLRNLSFRNAKEKSFTVGLALIY